MTRKSKNFAPQGTGEETQTLWVTTYGDMITNLMILFMILWAYTQFLHKEIAKPAMPQPSGSETTLKTEIKKQLEDVVAVVMTSQKLTVTLPSAVLFDPGSADLKESAQEALGKVAMALSRSTAPIVVEGHTDDTPIRYSDWRSNYELSAARAFSVIRYFTTTQGIPPQRLAARGYGPYRPVEVNDTDEDRAKNRRIEIHLWIS